MKYTRLEVLSRNAHRALVRPNKGIVPLWVGIIFDDHLGRELLDLGNIQWTPVQKGVKA